MGIQEEDKGKLFHLFGAIKNEEKNLNTKGIGLGLVISKLIVAKFNGYIDFISTYKKGSTFFYMFQLEQMLPQEFQRLEKTSNKSEMNSSGM